MHKLETLVLEVIPALDVNGRVQRDRNGAVVNLVGSGRQSSGDRDYFHKIPTLDLCRSLWDNMFEAHHNWGDTGKEKEDDEPKWEKIKLDEWIHKRRIVMNPNITF